MLKSVAEWKQLPELKCPIVDSAASKGVLHLVWKVGFLAVSPTDCPDVDKQGAKYMAGKFFFPTIEIDGEGGRVLHQLPLELTGWAISLMELVEQSRRSPFPSRVEFGILNGRHYAEMT